MSYIHQRREIMGRIARDRVPCGMHSSYIFRVHVDLNPKMRYTNGSIYSTQSIQATACIACTDVLHHFNPGGKRWIKHESAKATRKLTYCGMRAKHKSAAALPDVRILEYTVTISARRNALLAPRSRERHLSVISRRRLFRSRNSKNLHVFTSHEVGSSCYSYRRVH